MNRKKRLRCAAGFGSLILLLGLFLLLNMMIGSTHLAWHEIVQAFKAEGDILNRSILFAIRMPRLLAAALLGGALAVSGFLLQTFFANPIAGPFVLGISSSAKLVVAMTMIFCLGHRIPISSFVLIGAAFAGAMLCMGAILLASARLRSMSLLIVCGVMIGYICTAITDIMVTFADDSNIVNLHNWSLGSFSSMDMEDVATAALVILPALAIAFLLAKPMGAYQLGEAYARSMGVAIRRFRVELILVSSLLSAVVTSYAGPISFVGIAVPHLVKQLFGTAKPLIMVPACFLGGAVFCLGCDLIARTAFAPADISISTVTAVFGVPVVIAMLLKRGKSRE